MLDSTDGVAPHVIMSMSKARRNPHSEADFSASWWRRGRCHGKFPGTEAVTQISEPMVCTGSILTATTLCVRHVVR